MDRPVSSSTRAPTPALRGLYGIADADACAARGLELATVLRALLEAALPLVQIRAKSWEDAAIARLVEQELPHRLPGTRLIVNDRWELASRWSEQGVPIGLHLGQGDAALSVVRQKARALYCGLSTHDLAQLSEALRDRARPDYLAFGPVFTTSSKRNPEPTTGLDALVEARALAQSHRIPLVAIGGIQESNLELLAPHCDFVASISMLLPATPVRDSLAWITERARALDERVRHAAPIKSA